MMKFMALVLTVVVAAALVAQPASAQTAPPAEPKKADAPPSPPAAPPTKPGEMAKGESPTPANTKPEPAEAKPNGKKVCAECIVILRRRCPNGYEGFYRGPKSLVGPEHIDKVLDAKGCKPGVPAKPRVAVAPPPSQPPVVAGCPQRILRIHVRLKEELRPNHQALVTSREEGGEVLYRGRDDISRAYGAAIVASSPPLREPVVLNAMINGVPIGSFTSRGGFADIPLPPFGPWDFIGVEPVPPAGMRVSYPHRNPHGVHLLGFPGDVDIWKGCVLQGVVVLRR